MPSESVVNTDGQIRLKIKRATRLHGVSRG